MFESLYGSAWHHPGSFWLISGLFLAALVLQRPRQGGEARILWWLTLLLLAEISLDAWITSDSWSPLPNDSMVKGNLAIAFVIAGDLRYFLLLERYGHRQRPTPAHWLLVPLGLSLIVPITSLVAKLYAPDNPRVLFLTYELMLAALALFIRMSVLPKRELDDPRRRWMNGLSSFVTVQYLLWASADVMILSGLDMGYALRLVANTLYYAAFVPFAWLMAPKNP